MALHVQLRFARKVLACSSSEIVSSARPIFRRALARSSSVFATSGGTPQRPLSNRQGSTVQRFRVLRLPLDHAQLGQIHDTHRYVRMIEAQKNFSLMARARAARVPPWHTGRTCDG